MKKIISFSLFFAVFCANSALAYQIKGGAYTKRLNEGTKLRLVMSEHITTQDVEQGDMFQARLLHDVNSYGKTVLPKGTLIRGTVKDFRDNGIASKSAILYLAFDHVVTPQGRQLPIVAGVCSGFDMINPDGAISGGGNYFDELKRNFKKSGDIIANTSKWGVKSGDELFTGGRFLVAPIAAVGGVAGGALYLVGNSVYDIFRFGDEVVINQGQKFNIILLEPLDVPL